MKIQFKGLGLDVSVECTEGATCADAVATFERITQKSLANMDLYAGGKKIENFDDVASDEIVAVKSKHESASGTSIHFKGLGLDVKVECEEGATCSDAIAAFERLTQKSLSNMDLYAGGKKIENFDDVASDEIVAVKSKHESAL